MMGWLKDKLDLVIDFLSLGSYGLAQERPRPEEPRSAPEAILRVPDWDWPEPYEEYPKHPRESDTV